MPGPISESYQGPFDLPELPEPLLTVDDVRALVERCGKSWAVVMAGDDSTVQYVTWGKEPADKVGASDLAEQISAWVDGGGTDLLLPSSGPGVTYESFKLEAARNKAKLERLVAAAEAVLADSTADQDDHPALARLDVAWRELVATVAEAKKGGVA